MAVEGNLKSSLYKLEIIIIKVLPFIIAALYILSTILDYIGICSTLVNYIVYLMFFLFLYVSSYVFKFCEYHRMFIHYTTITWILNIIDLYIGIPVSDIWYLGIQLIIAGISLFIILYLYVKSYKKPTIKDSR